MGAQELIFLIESAQFETREEWERFNERVHAIFENLPTEEQEIIVEDNSFEMLSMILDAYNYSETE